MTSPHHQRSETSLLYFGTPVVLISSRNTDGSFNLAPMSSAFWLGWRCIIGLGATSATTGNLMREQECVLNLPSVQQVTAVDRLALTTGSRGVPEGKAIRGYRHEPDKFALAGLTPISSETVVPPRVLECPVQLEAKVVTWRGLGEQEEAIRGRTVVFELRVQRVHLAPAILLDGDPDRVDPGKWRPLIMSFGKFYGLTPDELSPSTLASIPERLYRSPDVDSARTIPVRQPAV
jgi:flavin reductase (DIM6/NTAB) family NADH-FMN oxidoreductase RutF